GGGKMAREGVQITTKAAGGPWGLAVVDQPVPRMALRIRSSVLLCVAYTGIEPSIGEIHEQVGKRDEDRGREQGSLDRVVVAEDHRIDEEVAQPRQVECPLDNHQPPDGKAELKAKDGKDGQEGVLQGVAEDDCAF